RARRRGCRCLPHCARSALDDRRCDRLDAFEAAHRSPRCAPDLSIRTQALLARERGATCSPSTVPARERPCEAGLAGPAILAALLAAASRVTTCDSVASL